MKTEFTMKMYRFILSGVLCLTVSLSSMAQDNPANGVDCEDWVLYYADITGGDFTSIYAVSFDEAGANLELIATSEIEVHIAYNSDDNLIYAVSNADGSYRTLDPHAESPEFSEVVIVEAEIDRITMAAFNNDNKLIIGDAGTDKFYTVDVTMNMISTYDSYAPIEGGDIAFGEDGSPFMATKEGNGGLYLFMDGDDFQIGDLPGNVTGMAIASSNQLLISRQGGTSFLVRELNGDDNGETIDIFLDGELFPTSAGDMASGCNTSNNNEGDCDDFSTFYASHGPGISGTDLYRVSFSGATATLTLLTNVNFEAHIAYNAELDLVYLVNANGSFIKAFDPTAGVFQPGNLPIGPGINSLYAIVYDPADGLLYVGDDSDNKIYTINLEDAFGTVTYYGNAPIQGGDLALQDGKLLVATRSGNRLLEVVEGADAVELGNIPGSVNGMARANNNSSLISAHTGQSQFFQFSAADGSPMDSFTAIYDGNPFTFVNGDMAADCGDSDDVEACEGPWRTQTQGGWGSPANGNNPGVYRDANFDAAFPEGLVIGCDFTLTLTSAQAVKFFLPSGGSPAVFDDNLVDPTGNEGSFTGNLVALALSLGFDAYDADFGESETPLADLFIQEDDFAGMTVGELFNIANEVIGGCNTDFTPSQVNDAVDAVNNSYVDGNEGDGSAFLGCNSETPDPCEGDNGECYATSAVYVQGVTTTANGNGVISGDRSNPDAALGEPEGTDQLGVFTSLGAGGSLTFQFGGLVPNGPEDDITVIETTFGNPGCDQYPEFADVSVSVDGVTFYHIGIVCKSQNSVDISDAVDINGAQVQIDCVNYVRVANNDELTTQLGDGFDVDGIIAIHNCENAEEADQVVQAITLSQDVAEFTSYPNPTAGPSQAVFTTMQTTRTSLEVYDMNGRSIATLFSGVANAGQQYMFDFDGAGLPNGVYIYRLTTETESVIEKFMIAK